MSSPSISASTPAPPQQESASSLLLASLTWSFICLLAAFAIYEVKAPAAVPARAPQNEFSAERALPHVRELAHTPRPIGSKANAAAREYLVQQLSLLGMNAQVSANVGVYNGFGTVVAANTYDVLARLPGADSSGAIMLMAHYDSVPSGPGASDDAAAVAAVLESVRALKSGPPLKNDLIVLFTDGEEEGLLGAEAFVASHPWSKDVALVMNFEARGNRGASLLFETSVNNRVLISRVAHAAPYPIGSSLFYALYKLLPNDTDVTVFRPTHAAALNFAFGGHLDAYHSNLDTPSDLDAASLQHHGSYALALVREFGQMNLAQLSRHGGDDVFFDWIGSNLIVYSESWVSIGEVVVTILLVVAIVFNLRHAVVRTGRLVMATFVAFAMLIVIPVTMTAAGWLLLMVLGERKILGDASANSFLLTGMVILGAALGGSLLTVLRNRFTESEFSLAGLIVVCLLSWTMALLIPAGSYLVFWPLMFATLGFTIASLLRRGSARANIIGALAGGVISILLFAPLGYLLYIFLTLNVLSIAAAGLLLSLFFVLCVPLVNMAVPRHHWRAILLPLLAAAGICLGVGIVQSHPSAEHPRRDNLLYSLNADDHTAAWISFDNALDRYTSQFIAGEAPDRHPVPDYLTGSQRKVFSAPAPVTALQPPIAEIKTYEKKGDLHDIRMTVKSQRDSDHILLRFNAGVNPVSVKMLGRNISPRQHSANFALLLYGVGAKDADIELVLKAPADISFWISDYSIGLPVTRQRNSEIVAAQDSDEMLVCRKYTIGSPVR